MRLHFFCVPLVSLSILILAIDRSTASDYPVTFPAVNQHRTVYSFTSKAYDGSLGGHSISTYTLGAGDIIEIDVFNVPEYSGEQQILTDGTLALAAIGRVSVIGLTLEQAEATIAYHYRNELQYPEITVRLVRARPLRVAISGEIQQPGIYSLSITDNAQFPSVAQVIQTAGGATQSANLKQVQIRRINRDGATQILEANLWELIQHSDLTQDIALRDGDEIIIPTTTEANMFETTQVAASNLAARSEVINIAVVGEVFRPGAYKLESSSQSQSGQPTVTEAIQMAGGIKPLANLSAVQVRRLTRQGTEHLINLDLRQLIQTGDLSQDLALQAGDTILLPTAPEISAAEATQLASVNLSPNSIQVNIVGEVNSPGRLEVPPNTTLNQAILAAGGFNQRAGNQVQLIRSNANGTINQQNLSADFAQGLNADTNPLLMNDDIIVVHPSSGSAFSDRFSGLLSPFLQIFAPLRLLF